MSNKVTTPYPLFSDIDGSPLNAGFLFLGESGKDPELFPIQVYWDKEKTDPAEQPIRTKNGYPSKNGIPSNFYVEDSSFSVTLKNRNQYLIASNRNFEQFANNSFVITQVETEKQRALLAESTLQTNINTENTRATGAESTLNTKIDNETSRALGVEQSLQLQISTSNAGIKYFQTEAALLATTPGTTDPKQAYAFDTKKLYLWNGTSWIDEGLSQLDQSKTYTDAKILDVNGSISLVKTDISNLAKLNLLEVNPSLTVDSGSNLYNTSGDVVGFYIADASSSTPYKVRTLTNARMFKIPVKAGESYFFSSTAGIPSISAISYSDTGDITLDKQLIGADVKSTSISTLKKVVVPYGVNFMFFNTKIDTLSYDITTTLILNKQKGLLVGWSGSESTDLYSRSELLKTIKDSDLETNASELKPNIATNQVDNFYIAAFGSANYGKLTALSGTALQLFPVEAGKTYAVYATNLNRTYFTVGVSNTNTVVAGKQLTPLTLADTVDPNVKTFTVPTGMSYAYATTYIPSLSFDIRAGFWVNEGTKSSRNDVLTVHGIKTFEIRDPLAQTRLDNLTNYSILKGKRWIAIGDSITEKNSRANKNYHDFIREDVGGMTVYNKGISGSGFHDRMDVANTLTEQTDYITILWGTNDWGLVRNTYPLGTFLSNDTNTISGRINSCLSQLITKYPLAKIAIISALPRLDNYGSNAAPNSVGYTLKQHVDLLAQYAAHYSLPFLDLYGSSNLPVWVPAANDYYFTAPGASSPDGLHPNDAGQRLMADKIKVFLESI
ncbi:SGNH/GDSL hydrolase family protein [Acinetobacter baumannii]|uniref:SGNH/GDSL hydrolase family protein n=1 Tax=Acinetobacter baumannii TaxID=470 RepID=UPI003A8A791D